MKNVGGRGREAHAATRLVDVEWWGRWLNSRAGRRRWSIWAAEQPPLAGWQPAELLSPIGCGPTDAMQASLVAVAQGGDGDAAFVLLVQLRPGLHRLARWSAANGLWPPQESVAEVRASFFETLYRHRLDRRPTKIAANLILDTRQRISRSSRAARADDDRRRSHVQQRLPNGLRSLGPTRPGRSGIAEGVEGAPVGPGGVDGALDPIGNLTVGAALAAAVERLPGSDSSRRLTASVAYRAWILDQPRAVIASDLGLGAATVTTRLHRLRSVVDRADLIAQ